eukprot:12282818-Alexandrium_andersonii.AAC.1
MVSRRATEVASSHAQAAQARRHSKATVLPIQTFARSPVASVPDAARVATTKGTKPTGPAQCGTFTSGGAQSAIRNPPNARRCCKEGQGCQAK